MNSIAQWRGQRRRAACGTALEGHGGRLRCKLCIVILKTIRGRAYCNDCEGRQITASDCESLRSGAQHRQSRARASSWRHSHTGSAAQMTAPRVAVVCCSAQTSVLIAKAVACHCADADREDHPREERIGDSEQARHLPVVTSIASQHTARNLHLHARHTALMRSLAGLQRGARTSRATRTTAVKKRAVGSRKGRSTTAMEAAARAAGTTV